ncbi:MAG TPA: ABC transporter substrate-binding protein [Pyrinomonadaceae bacterium]|nr:ABC transporter substrate-binding protein [Pyrinomonadaceae bacterium]
MPTRHVARALCALLALAALLAGCGGGGGGAQPFVTILDTTPSTLDPLDGTDAASERLRQLIFNSLVRKNERFEYVGDLAESYQVSEDGKTYSFTLQPDVTFHDGRPLTSADAKYTLESLFNSSKRKRASFFESPPGGGAAQPYVTSVEAPDPRTLVITLRKPWNQLLPNLVSLPVIPQGSADTQKTQPAGSGPFRFVRYDENQLIADLAAYDRYWQGAPSIKDLRLRIILDANTLQAELQSGRIDIISGAANLSPDTYKFLAMDPTLKVEQFPGANIVYLGFNVERPPLDNVRLRQAIAHAIDREAIVRDLMLGQARVAHSILPEGSWAYDPGQKYPYDPARARQLLDEGGLPDPDGDGPRMRLAKPIVFKISSGNAAVSQFAGVIQNSLKAVGVPVEIETLETNTLLKHLGDGQYEMTTLRWIGGNQDPVFLRDLFHSTEIPGPTRTNVRNRNRYSNSEFDRVIDQAVNTPDRERARELYVQAQQIVSRDLPMLPLWYPDVMVIARKNVENIRVDASNDYSFLRSVTVNQQ